MKYLTWPLGKCLLLSHNVVDSLYLCIFFSSQDNFKQILYLEVYFMTMCWKLGSVPLMKAWRACPAAATASDCPITTVNNISWNKSFVFRGFFCYMGRLLEIIIPRKWYRAVSVSAHVTGSCSLDTATWCLCRAMRGTVQCGSYQHLNELIKYQCR